MLDIRHQQLIQGFVVFNLVWAIQCVPPHINSKYLPLMPYPPPPFAMSLYRAPQTYDRGKTMSRPRNPYILISKVIPCYGNQKNAGRHFDKLQRPNMNNPSFNTQINYYRPPMVKFTETHVQHLPTFQQVSAPHVTEEFSGSWAITKPDNDPALDQNDGDLMHNGVTYNEDGTRVLTESTLDTQFNPQLFTSSEGDGGNDAATNGFTPPPPLAGLYVPLATTPIMEDLQSEFNTMTTPIEDSLTTVPITVETTIETTENDEDRTVLQETTDTTPATDRQSLSTVIMDKLGGGAKNMLVQILGGILNNNGGQSQNFKDKTEKQLSEKAILESPSPFMNSNAATDSPNSQTDTFPSYFNHQPQSYSTGSPDQTYKEEPPRPTLTTSEVRTSGEHPLTAMVTSITPQQQVTNTAASYIVQKKEEERGSTSGWRPLQWPALWPIRPPSQQRPPSPPATILNWLHTSWNHSSLTHESSLTPNLESDGSSFNDTSIHPEIPTSTPIPRLPSSFIEKNLEGTPSIHISKVPPLLLVDWLLGTPQNTGKNQTLINKNRNLTDLMKLTEYENETIDEFVSNGIPVVKSNSSSNRTLVSNNEWTGRKHDISDSVGGQVTEIGNYKQEMVNVESAIRELKKLYEKLRLGIPTPFHIFRRLKTLHPTLAKIMTISKY